MKASLAAKDQERWKTLRERYRHRGVVLALGAGVSTQCKLPSWPELMRRIGGRCLGAHGERLVDQLILAGTTLPAVAGILESKCRKGAGFIEVLREELYRDFPFKETKTQTEKKALIDFVNNGNSTMRAVTAFCAKATSKREFTPNELVRAVVNFNVDSVLRSYAQARYAAYLFRTIDTADRLARPGRIPIYHMHGFLKFGETADDRQEEEARCVFTEAEYYDFFNRPNSVFNYTFLYLLREFNCVFIGMSMIDENIRRLLHYSTAERRERAVKAGESNAERTALRHFAILKKTDSKELDQLTDLSLRRLGTRALWINDFSEIPHWLAYTYGEDAWDKVY